MVQVEEEADEAEDAAEAEEAEDSEDSGEVVDQAVEEPKEAAVESVEAPPTQRRSKRSSQRRASGSGERAGRAGERGSYTRSLEPPQAVPDQSSRTREVVTLAVAGIGVLGLLGLLMMGVKKVATTQGPKIAKAREVIHPSLLPSPAHSPNCCLTSTGCGRQGQSVCFCINSTTLHLYPQHNYW